MQCLCPSGSYKSISTKRLKALNLLKQMSPNQHMPLDRRKCRILAALLNISFAAQIKVSANGEIVGYVGIDAVVPLVLTEISK